MQYGEDVDVADWFAGFCTMYRGDGAEEPPQEASPPKKARRGSRKSTAAPQVERCAFKISVSLLKMIDSAKPLHEVSMGGQVWPARC